MNEHWPPCGAGAWIVAKHPYEDFEIRCSEHGHRWIPDMHSSVVFTVPRPQPATMYTDEEEEE